MKNTRHSNWQKSINQLKDEMNELLSKRKELTLKSKDIWINTSGDAKTRRRLHRDICGNVMCNEICSLRKQIRENSTLSHMFKKQMSKEQSVNDISHLQLEARIHKWFHNSKPSRDVVDWFDTLSTKEQLDYLTKNKK